MFASRKYSGVCVQRCSLQETPRKGLRRGGHTRDRRILTKSGSTQRNTRGETERKRNKAIELRHRRPVQLGQPSRRGYCSSVQRRGRATRHCTAARIGAQVRHGLYRGREKENDKQYGSPPSNGLCKLAEEPRRPYQAPAEAAPSYNNFCSNPEVNGVWGKKIIFFLNELFRFSFVWSVDQSFVV